MISELQKKHCSLIHRSHFSVNTVWPHNYDETSPWGSSLRNNMVILNNSLLSRKYFRHEIYNTIEQKHSAGGVDEANCGLLPRHQIAFVLQKVEQEYVFMAPCEILQFYGFSSVYWLFLQDEWNALRQQIVFCYTCVIFFLTTYLILSYE